MYTNYKISVADPIVCASIACVKLKYSTKYLSYDEIKCPYTFKKRVFSKACVQDCENYIRHNSNYVYCKGNDLVTKYERAYMIQRILELEDHE